MGQASPYEVIPSQNEIDVFINTQKCFHGDFPMNLSLTHIAYFYFTFYCGRPTTSAVGSDDEDKSYSVYDGMTFGSDGGGMTFTSDPSSTPSAG